MSKKTICSHTLVRNEGRFLWFAVMSVINHVDRVLLWDTGSTDQTIEIISEIKRMFPKKVSVNKIVKIDSLEFFVKKYFIFLGNFYYYKNEQTSHYRIYNYIGSITIRAM